MSKGVICGKLVGKSHICTLPRGHIGVCGRWPAPGQLLEIKVAVLNQTLSTLILWMSQSANSPLRIEEAQTLLKDLKE